MESRDAFRYVFGPVPSRRLGRSLGVDIVPAKYCTFDCVYCQVGRTTCLTTERRDFVPIDAVVAEVVRKLDAGAAPDHITISGSGEPTLHARLGDLIAALKARTDVPVAVITNGSLLGDPAVQEALLGADVVLPSLDAGDAAALLRINRPHPSLGLDGIVEGLVSFRARYAKALWLEVFVLDDTTEADIDRIAALVKRIRPDRVQINTAVRPAADASVRPASRARLEQFADRFEPRAEVIAAFEGDEAKAAAHATEDDVLNMLKRRPCSVDDVASGLGISRAAAETHVERLLKGGRLCTETRSGITYYFTR